MTAMGRPRDWHPLADTDPVPGDPDAILDEVAHLKGVAAMLRREAGDLRVIAQGDGLEGRYAETLRDGARDLEGHLGATAGRYERVHGHLTCWASELAGFQSDADRILRTARADAEAAASGPAGSGSGSDDPMAVHRASLAKVEALRDERAGHYGRLIGHQIDDEIKDSRWQRLKNTVDDWQAVISFAVDVMSWTATVIAVAALLTTPAGWVAGLALWLSAGVLAGHFLLAAAGDGSWADVAMDVFGLLTMHVGNGALTELRGVRDATKLAAQAAADENAAANSARATQAVRDRASAVVNRRGATRAERARARHDRNIARASNLRAGRDAAAAEAATPMPEASRWEAVSVGGDVEEAGHIKDIRRLRVQYARSAEVLNASAGAERLHNTSRLAWGAASAVDGGDKTLGSSDVMWFKPDYAPYGRAKDRYTKEVGTAW
jgi:hypothetical protein